MPHERVRQKTTEAAPDAVGAPPLQPPLPRSAQYESSDGLGLRASWRLPPGHDLARRYSQFARLPVVPDAAAEASADAADPARLHGRHRPPRPAARVSRFYGAIRSQYLERLRRATRSILRRPHRKVLAHRAAEGRPRRGRRQGPPPALPEGPAAPEMAPVRKRAAHVQGALAASRAVPSTRGHLTMPWVVSFAILTEMLRAGLLRGGRARLAD